MKGVGSIGEEFKEKVSVPFLAILVAAVLVFIVRTQTDRQNQRGGSTLYSRNYQLSE